MNTELIITSSELNILKNCLDMKRADLTPFNKARLENEVKTANIVTENALPEDVIKLNSFVHLQELVSQKKYSFQLVLPAQLGGGKNKISIYAPISIAILGYRAGDVIEWEMPAGLKKYKIINVMNGIQK